MPLDWKTAVLLLPSTFFRLTNGGIGLEDCRIITSFYLQRLSKARVLIGRLPYYYFLLLSTLLVIATPDWKTAVLLLPSTAFVRIERDKEIGRLPYYYFLLLLQCWRIQAGDWKTAVLLLPSTPRTYRKENWGLEDCRIITSFYSASGVSEGVWIGRLPYYYFLLLWRRRYPQRLDWKTAVLLLPSTQVDGCRGFTGLEDCRIITSFYWLFRRWTPGKIGRLPYYYFLLLYMYSSSLWPDWKTAVLLLPSTLVLVSSS